MNSIALIFARCLYCQLPSRLALTDCRAYTLVLRISGCLDDVHLLVNFMQVSALFWGYNVNKRSTGPVSEWVNNRGLRPCHAPAFLTTRTMAAMVFFLGGRHPVDGRQRPTTAWRQMTMNSVLNVVGAYAGAMWLWISLISHVHAVCMSLRKDF